jgi:flavin-dependent dehydrogenase
MAQSSNIVVAGTGPAGAATALGLVKLGFEVTAVSSPRPFVACEGISERVMQGLENAGFRRALEVVAAPSRRMAHWNGAVSDANSERLVRRDRFDQALLEDLVAAGVTVLPGRVQHTLVERDAARISATDPDGKPIALDAVFFIDARGRAAPAAGRDRMRGPETVSLLQAWHGSPCPARSAAVSFREGWAWLASFSDGSRYTQLTLAAGGLPPRPQLEDYFFPRIRGIPEAVTFIEDAQPYGELQARSATAILTSDPIETCAIRVGDAALAVDPLSGNGIFQSLSTALLAPRVINTVLHRPERAELARQFYRERVNHAFMRFARLGRDFYCRESRWTEQSFWRDRREWPDAVPTHEPPAPGAVTVAKRPVVSGDFIEEAEVVLTPDQPLGIWHLQGIELAPLVRLARKRLSQGRSQASPDVTEALVAEFLEQHHPGSGPEQQRLLVQWLRHHGMTAAS